jgi:hypothetical protein
MGTRTGRSALAAVVALLAGSLLCARPVVAQQVHEHEQAGPHSGTAAVAQIKLNDGKKWPTDASLRSGMAAIREAFEADHPAIHAGTQTDAQYEALAAGIEQQVSAIVANCKLPPAADANLHFLIADLLQGANLMRGKDPARSRHDGAALVHGALRAYGKAFDDPAWGA